MEILHTRRTETPLTDLEQRLKINTANLTWDAAQQIQQKTRNIVELAQAKIGLLSQQIDLLQDELTDRRSLAMLEHTSSDRLNVEISKLEGRLEGLAAERQKTRQDIISDQAVFEATKQSMYDRAAKLERLAKQEVYEHFQKVPVEEALESARREVVKALLVYSGTHTLNISDVPAETFMTNLLSSARINQMAEKERDRIDTAARHRLIQKDISLGSTKPILTQVK